MKPKLNDRQIQERAVKFKAALQKLRAITSDLREGEPRPKRKAESGKRRPRNKTSVLSVPSVVKKSCNKDCGVGTELMAILADLGVHSKPTCPCKSLAKKMDRNGIEWCRENLDSLVASMRENSQYFAWTEKAGVGLRSLPLILSGKLNPMRPLESLINLAIERAETKKGNCCAK